jgi:precorrin-3B methylase
MITAAQAKTMSDTAPNMYDIEQKIKEAAEQGFTTACFYSPLSERQLASLALLGYKVYKRPGRTAVDWSTSPQPPMTTETVEI